MKQKSKWLAAIAMPVLLGACQLASQTPPEVTVSAHNLEDHGLRLDHSSAHFDKGNLEIAGAIKRNRLQTSSPIGHLDIAAFDADGKLLAETTAYYSPRLISTRTNRKHGARFSVSMPSLPEQTVSVRVAFHKDELTDQSAILHKQSVFAGTSAPAQ
ncbi:MAG: hypothetical protein HPY82_09230 [Gammaproteobacteria bacterium]|nr:hypothetical protein [Gammaproteobacteria bacterium]